jgi:citrate lyase beta subunit
MHSERSVLSVPGTNWHRIEKALSSPADVVFIDLEDSVAPTAKAEARVNVIRAMQELDWGTRPPAIRVNALDTPFFYRDLVEVVEVVGGHLGLIIVPKVDDPTALVVADTLLTQIEKYKGLAVGRIKVEAQIESAAGLVHVEQIATASPRLEALIFGPGDYAASMHMPVTSIGARDEWDERYPGHRFHYAMARIVVAARTAGLRAIDGPLADYHDIGGYRHSALLARSLGYDGKWCIHPRQVLIANEVFSPTAEEIAWAHKVVAAYEQALSAGSGVISVDERMIDMASVRMAQATLELARRASGE